MKKSDFDKLTEGIKQAGKIRRGEMKAGRVFQFKPADIKVIRINLNKSQAEFALMIGVSLSTLQNWEQGRRSPKVRHALYLKLLLKILKLLLKP